MPAGMTISFPWNHDLGLLDALDSRQHQFERLYAPFFVGVAPSSRGWGGPTNRSAYMAEMEEVCSALRAWNKGLTLVSNVAPWQVHRDSLVEDALYIRARVPRLRVVFSDLDTALGVVRRLEGIEMGVSTMAKVSTVGEALLWRELAGASIVTVSRSVNRKPAVLEAIRDAGVAVSVVAFDNCIPNCPFEAHHLVFGAEGGADCSSLVFRNSCHPESLRLTEERPYLMARKEILPGHLRHLAGIVSEVKIAGREKPTVEILRFLDLYTEGTSLAHPEMPYCEPPEAWDKVASCNENCPTCGYCERAIAVPGGQQSGISEVPATTPAEIRPSNVPGLYRFVRADGAQVEVGVYPKGPHRAIREVQGRAIYYRGTGATDDECVQLLHAVADALVAAGYDEVQQPTPTLRRQPWPSGFRLLL